MVTAHFSARTGVADPFSRRQILPADIFTRDHWGVSATVREVLDLDRQVPMVPPPAADIICESVILSGAEVFTSMRKGSAVISHRRVLAAFEAPELSIVMEATPTPVTPLQADAQQALNALAARKRAVPVQEPSAGLGHFAGWVLVIGALVFTAHELLAVLR